MAEGRKFTMVSLGEVPDDWTIAVPGAVGGGGAWEYVLEDVTRDNLPTLPDDAERAMEELRKQSGKKIDAIMLCQGTSLVYFTNINWSGGERLFACVIPAKGEPFFVCPAFEEDRAIAESLSSNDQVAELADEFAVFQGETKNALTAVVSVVAVIGVLLLFINLVLIIK